MYPNDEAHYPFPLQPLPYAYDALEPAIDARTLHFHHDKHLNTYVTRLNEALSGYPALQGWSLARLLTNLEAVPAEIRAGVKNNAGGVYSHQLYFDCMTGEETRPSTRMLAALNASFGSFEGWKSRMKEAAVSLFGSGWAWLVRSGDGSLHIVRTPNQDTPLPLRPLLLVDVWEHAYYLQYQNLRDVYVENWFGLIDWEHVQHHFQ